MGEPIVKYESEIKSTLRLIFGFVGADLKYAEYAQLITWIEQLIKRCGVS